MSEKNTCGSSQCENHAACTGGCPSHGYFHSGDLNSTDIRCSSRSWRRRRDRIPL